MQPTERHMNETWVRVLEIELQRQAIVSLLVLLIVFCVGMWALYQVIKAAIRDGIRESGLLEVRHQTWRAAVNASSGPDTIPHMPEMRAER